VAGDEVEPLDVDRERGNHDPDDGARGAGQRGRRMSSPSPVRARNETSIDRSGRPARLVKYKRTDRGPSWPVSQCGKTARTATAGAGCPTATHAPTPAGTAPAPRRAPSWFQPGTGDRPSEANRGWVPPYALFRPDPRPATDLGAAHRSAARMRGADPGQPGPGGGDAERRTGSRPGGLVIGAARRPVALTRPTLA